VGAVISKANCDSQSAAPSSAGAERPPGLRPRRRLRCRSVAVREKRSRRRITIPDSDSESQIPDFDPNSLSPDPATDRSFDADSSVIPPRPCEAGPVHNTLTILQCNIRGWLSHSAELHGQIRLLPTPPSILLLNETLLNPSISVPKVSGYTLVGRHETASTKRGIAAYALDNIAPDIVLLSKSSDTERMWFLLHSHIGPILLCVWYRRPDKGEIASVVSLREECSCHKSRGLGTIIIGDLNIHHRRWLCYSSHNSPEGEVLHNFCTDHGFAEHVRSPTRENYLLDLVLSDLQSSIRTRVLPGISDHSMVLAAFDTGIPVQGTSERVVWKYHLADWSSMRSELGARIWNGDLDTDPNIAATELSRAILEAMDRHIPKATIHMQSGDHPWFDETCVEAVQRKNAAWGTARQQSESAACGEILLRQFLHYVGATKGKRKEVRRESKKWWQLSKGLMHKSTSTAGIPALRSANGWARAASEKANLLADTFQSKWVLPPEVVNELSSLPVVESAPDSLIPIRARHTKSFLKKLRYWARRSTVQSTASPEYCLSYSFCEIGTLYH